MVTGTATRAERTVRLLAGTVERIELERDTYGSRLATSLKVRAMLTLTDGKRAYVGTTVGTLDVGARAGDTAFTPSPVKADTWPWVLAAAEAGTRDRAALLVHAGDRVVVEAAVSERVAQRTGRPYVDANRARVLFLRRDGDAWRSPSLTADPESAAVLPAPRAHITEVPRAERIARMNGITPAEAPSAYQAPATPVASPVAPVPERPQPAGGLSALLDRFGL